ncbi:DnaT-like ssDNA-binding domain-containing protein [Marinomonas ostreistagni]|uniref:DnaT-like ssDNA-binding domain-containing protein n=1 Tax=Marinomonas ostreistagni TaxID=359209 RepID=UPI0019518091|nr:DnaT-like ssDNA-binding domain-containing protein [Marinomonas ostreistagni]MBM6549595.1 hypothetical protein [Marinomonas ostreistagni]
MVASDFTLPVSFNLACELGLEESVLLTFLQQRAHHLGSRQIKVSHRELVDMLPFWTAPYTVRLMTTLQVAQRLQFRRSDAGLEIMLEAPGEVKPKPSSSTTAAQSSEADGGEMLSKLSRLQQEAAHKEPSSAPQYSPRASREPSESYAPATSPAPSDRRGLTDFDLYLEAKERNRQPDQWLPEEATLEQIQQAGIERGFAQALLPEFLLRIKEQRKNVRTWNSEFFKYVKRQWQYKQSDRQSHEGTATYSANSKSSREQVSNALTNIHDTDW